MTAPHHGHGHEHADQHGHVPVLPDACLKLLGPNPGETAVDLTAGRGGHAVELAKATAPGGRIALCDLDPGNLAYAGERVARESPTTLVSPFHGSFVRMPSFLRSESITADVLLADLGFASTQVDDPDRGLGFSHDGPLDMRLDPTRADQPTAADLLRTADERTIADLIFRFGEDPYSRAIARKLVEIRRAEPISTTRQLAEAVRDAYGHRAHQSRNHPATRTFMALRIAVNDELGALASLLDMIAQAAESASRGQSTWLAPNARIGIISFHSLEDRLVKRAFAALENAGHGTRLTRKPIVPSDAETHDNPRSRSAKLRGVRVARSG